MATAERASSNAEKAGIWTPEAELALYMSMIGLRPVGIHRNFRLINIYTRLQNRLGANANITYTDMKTHLESLFDMQLLDDIEDENEEEEAEEEEEEEEEEGEKEEEEREKKTKSGAHSATKFNPKANVKNEEEDDEDAGQDDGDDDERVSDEGESESSDDASEDNSEEKDGQKRSLEDGLNIASFIPLTSIGTTLDTADPLFWRKKNAEFVLPWLDFGTMMVERAGIGVSEDHDDAETAEQSASAISTPAMASTPASTATPKVMSPEPELAEGEQNRGADTDSGRNSPVLRRRKGRSLTPVPRSRSKSARATAAASGSRKRAKGR
ncbi:hypothetical protein EV178_004628 [Coemansia sp. RSA 1646]|nr:hypothetical protein EV178_004628 [Coemansia sp. RSA 1646]